MRYCPASSFISPIIPRSVFYSWLEFWCKVFPYEIGGQTSVPGHCAPGPPPVWSDSPAAVLRTTLFRFVLDLHFPAENEPATTEGVVAGGLDPIERPRQAL